MTAEELAAVRSILLDPRGDAWQPGQVRDVLHVVAMMSDLSRPDWKISRVTLKASIGAAKVIDDVARELWIVSGDISGYLYEQPSRLVPAEEVAAERAAEERWELERRSAEVKAEWFQGPWHRGAHGGSA